MLFLLISLSQSCRQSNEKRQSKQQSTLAGAAQRTLCIDQCMEEDKCHESRFLTMCPNYEIFQENTRHVISRSQYIHEETPHIVPMRQVFRVVAFRLLRVETIHFSCIIFTMFSDENAEIQKGVLCKIAQDVYGRGSTLWRRYWLDSKGNRMLIY